LRVQRGFAYEFIISEGLSIWSSLNIALRVPRGSCIWSRYRLKRSLDPPLFLFFINEHQIRKVRVRNIILHRVYLELLLEVQIQLVDGFMRRTLLVVQEVFSILFIVHIFI
jgi:hypothetical protein